MKNLGAFHALALLGVSASLALLFGLIVLTRQMDREQEMRERVLLSEQVDADLQASAMSVMSAARNDEGVRRLDHGRDHEWAATTFPNATDVHVWFYTFDRANRFISGLHGPRYQSDALAKMEAKLPARIAALRSKKTFNEARRRSAAAFDFFWSGDKLYFLLAAPFSPATKAVELQHRTPPVLAAVMPFEVFLTMNLAGTGLQDVQVKPFTSGKPSGKVVMDARGKPLASVVWRSSQPGAELLRLIIAPVLALVGAFVLLLAYAYRRACAAQRALIESKGRAHHFAFHDQLTGLANRRYFTEKLGSAVIEAADTGASLALLLIDLDRFKAVNDSYGHQCGDELICETARRLNSVCGPGDLCARLGGDEFVILATGRDAAAAGALAESALKILTSPVQLSLAIVQTAGSIGVSLFRSGSDTESLMREADLALYRVKDQGRNGFKLFESQMSHTSRHRQILEVDFDKPWPIAV